MDKGAELNKRVWALFAKAGFETMPNSADPAEHVVLLSDGKERPVDLLARVQDLNVMIIGSNKSRKKLQSFTAHIHDLEELVEAEEATCALFVAGEKEMDTKERSFAHKHGVQVWDQQQLAYYEAVVEAIGNYAKYEIIHALGVTTSEEVMKATVVATRLKQPRSSAPNKTDLYIFALPADILLRTCVVLRKAQGSAYAYQRILSKKRLPRIGAFLGTPDALIPTNIVVHLGEDVAVEVIKPSLANVNGKKIKPTWKDHELVSLDLPLEYGSLELIDGQHRLFGFVHTDETTREKFPLPVLGLRNMNEKHKSSTFVAINDNARRVDASLVSYLRYTNDERTCQRNADLMAIKIVVELNRASPFRDAIRLLDFGPQRLTLKGLSGYDLRGLVAPKGLLRTYYSQNRSKQYIRVLRTHFSVIKEHFPSEWKDASTYIIATNRGITAFLKLLRSILKTEERRLSKRATRKYIAALRRHWPGGWQTANLKTAYVGSQGWKRFHQAMVQSIRKKYKTFQE